MNATKTKAEILYEIEEAIREIMHDDLRHGANNYAYVRVWPDLTVTSGREPSYCVPEGEYFKRTPHCVTVWSASGMRTSAGFDDDVFEWEEVEAPADLDENEDRIGYRYARDNSEEDLNRGEDGKWYRLTEDLANPLDLSDVMQEVETRLDESNQPWWAELA